MRGLKSTVALGVILAGLAGYIIFVENKKPAGDTPVKTKAWVIEGSAITEVTVRSSGGDTTRLRKSGDSWVVAEPVQAAADDAVTSSIVNGLAGLEIDRVLDEKPAGLKDYGLDPARIEVTFRTSADSSPKRLLIGEKTPGSGELYAQTDRSGAVVLIASFHENAFNKGSFELREKAILKFDRTKADGLEIAHGSTTLKFARSGDVDWSMSQPFAARGDFAAIDGAISVLASTQVQKFVTETAADLKAYGLDKPELTARLTSDGKTQTLLVGKSVEGTRYAKRTDSPAVFTVGENLLADLKKDGNDFRRKDIFDFRAFTANRIEVARGASVLSFEKIPGKDTTTPDNWKASTGKQTESIKAEDSILKVTGLRADGFVPAVPAAMKTPDAVVTVTFDDNKKTEVIRFFVKDASVFATREGEPGAAQVTRTAYDEALKALDSLK
ncbi:MAG: DUF4340 domain-containing protein [Vicinamibacterales bacterium]